MRTQVFIRKMMALMTTKLNEITSLINSGRRGNFNKGED